MLFHMIFYIHFYCMNEPEHNEVNTLSKKGNMIQTFKQTQQK